MPRFVIFGDVGVEPGIDGPGAKTQRNGGQQNPPERRSDAESEKRQRRDVPFRRLDFDDMFLERKPYPPATTLMIRREALDKVGGFDPSIRLEDLYIEPEAAPKKTRGRKKKEE